MAGQSARKRSEDTARRPTHPAPGRSMAPWRAAALPGRLISPAAVVSLATVASLASVLFLAAVLLGGGPAAAAGPMRIGTSGTGLLVWIAKGMGGFEEAGADVEVEKISSGVEGLDRVLAGELDLAASSEFAFISHAMRAPGLCIYATLSASRTVRLLARADRVGPAPADLAGKRIGVTLGSVARFFLWQYMTLSEVAEDRLVLVDMSPGEMPQAMQTGAIDAAIVWEPFVTRIRDAMRGELVEYPDQSLQHYYFVLHGRCDLAERRGQELRAVLTALVEAGHMAGREPERAKALAQPVLKLDGSKLDEVWPLHSLGVTLPQDLLMLMEMEARWLREEGLSSADAPDILQLVSPAALAETAPDAVQMVW